MRQTRSFSANFIFVLILFAVYAISALVLCALGARAYQKSASFSESNYDIRTSSLYLTEKIRQSDTLGGVKKSVVDGADALVLSAISGKNVYETWIFTADGYLREITVPLGGAVSAAFAQKVMPLMEMSVTQEDSVLRIETNVSGGEAATLLIGARCAQEAT